jgi:sugar/nucleoside kinase (ribokinase family)
MKQSDPITRPIIVAGHICLDIIPRLDAVPDLRSFFVPGTLAEVGPAVLSTGGAVSNTGLALHKLGFPVSLIGKLGGDDFGHAVLAILERQGAPTSGMIVCPGENTSYTIVVNPPGIDRMFLHCPGANHTFCADDIDDAALGSTALFHFGYPTLMRRIYSNRGEELKAIFQRARMRGIRTSLDMTCVDPASEAGRVDWLRWLENVLPHTDLFLPSIDEILFMVARPVYDALCARHNGNLVKGIDASLIERTAQQLIDLGASVAVIKLGDQGLYLRTAAAVPGQSAFWGNVRIFTPCFEANVAGTTGAGDCTIAGFLAGFVEGGDPAAVAEAACGVGGFSTEAPGATAAVPRWEAVRARIDQGWKRRASKFA